MADRGEIRILGIETSCDETAAAVVARTPEGFGRILANVVRSQLAEHAVFGGVVPEIAARAHVAILDQLIEAAMAEAQLDWSGLDAVAVTAGPGLIGGLMVGLVTAKAIALARGLPLVAVNHLEAHALTPGLTEARRPPYLLLLISGGHTQTLVVKDVGAYTRLGTTVDDALGEAFDKTAKLLGLGYPGGAAVERWAAKGDPERFALPRPMMGREEPHFSFSGLKTAVRHVAKKLEPLSDRDICDLCASFQAAVVESLRDRVDRAMQLFLPMLSDLSAGASGAHARRPALVVAGGVAANAVLRRHLQDLTKERGFELSIPPAHLCTDNAAMIAWAGAERLVRGLRDPLDTPARARWPLDPAAPPAIGAGVKA